MIAEKLTARRLSERILVAGHIGHPEEASHHWGIGGELRESPEHHAMETEVKVEFKLLCRRAGLKPGVVAVHMDSIHNSLRAGRFRPTLC